jgi:hypothetical protein
LNELALRTATESGVVNWFCTSLRCFLLMLSRVLLKPAFLLIVAGLFCSPWRTRPAQQKKKNIHSNQWDEFLEEDDQYHPIYGLSRIFEN